MKMENSENCKKLCFNLFIARLKCELFLFQYFLFLWAITGANTGAVGAVEKDEAAVTLTKGAKVQLPSAKLGPLFVVGTVVNAPFIAATVGEVGVGAAF